MCGVITDAIPEAREVLQATSIRQRPAGIEVVQLAFCLIVAQRLTNDMSILISSSLPRCQCSSQLISSFTFSLNPAVAMAMHIVL